jgi:hypothetical protein
MKPRLLLVIAILLALAAGPPQPPMEGAWGYEHPAVVRMSGEDLVVTATIARDDTYDPTLRLFTLQLGAGGAVTVMGSQDLPLVRWLEARVGQRVPITFQEGR